MTTSSEVRGAPSPGETGRIGLLLVGVNGAVASSVTAGLIGCRLGLCEPYGMVTALPELSGLGLTPLENLVVGGWDLRDEPHDEAIARHGLVPQAILREIAEEAARVPVLPGPPTGVGPVIAEVAGFDSGRRRVSRLEAVNRIARDIEAFRREEHLDGVVVVNLASTEPAIQGEEAPPATPDELEAALRRDAESLTSGMLYAYAAVTTGSPYVNFTPSLTVDLPALTTLAERLGVAIAGKDGKTGQTLYKTVLAPMLRWRNLRLVGWYSTNILGNDDGRVLDDVEHRAVKCATKRGVLPEILGYDDFDHQVHIHYYPPRGDAKEAWDSIDFQGWLGARMSLRINWQGQDSILAAPLVIDLARLIWLAQRRGEGGPANHLAAFFKSPIGGGPHDFLEQTRRLLAYCEACRAERRDSVAAAVP